MPYKNLQINPPKYSNQVTTRQSQFYIGFSSVNKNASSGKLYDYELIKQDIMNQFNTRKGERVMNPTFGTIIWDVIFDPFTSDIKQQIIEDVTRICNYDPRVVPTNISVYEQEYGMLIDITLLYKQTNQVDNMKLAFDKEAGLIAQ